MRSWTNAQQAPKEVPAGKRELHPEIEKSGCHHEGKRGDLAYYRLPVRLHYLSELDSIPNQYRRVMMVAFGLGLNRAGTAADRQRIDPAGGQGTKRVPALLGRTGPPRNSLSKSILLKRVDLGWNAESEMERSRHGTPPCDVVAPSPAHGQAFWCRGGNGVKQDAYPTCTSAPDADTGGAFCADTCVGCPGDAFFFSITVSVPFLLCAVLLAFSAFRLYNIGRRGAYPVLEGTVLKCRAYAVASAAKAMLMEVEGKLCWSYFATGISQCEREMH